MKTRKTSRSAPARPSLKTLGLWHPLLDRPEQAPARDLQHAASGFEMSMAMHPIGLRAIGAEVFHSAAGRMT